MNTIFNKIINNEIPSFKLYEDEILIIILDINPTCDGHCLIIPKTNYETFMDIPDDILLHINKISKEYTNILVNKLKTNSMSIGVNYLDAQEIKHYHMHLLPNTKTPPTMSIEEVYNILTKE